MESIYSTKRHSDRCWKTALLYWLLALINEKKISFSLMFNRSLAMFSIQCHYYCEKDMMFISHSSKTCVQSNTKGSFSFSPSLVLFSGTFYHQWGTTGFLLTPGLSRKQEQNNNNKKNQSWRVNSVSMQQWFHCHVLYYSPWLSLFPHDGFSRVSPFAQGSKTDVTPHPPRHTDTHTSPS